MNQTIEELTQELRQELIKQLNLEDMIPADFDENTPLFGEGLGLDSIDSLELVVLLDRNYGIKLKDPKEGRQVFHSIRTMAEYIQKNRAQV
ncbi:MULTISPECIES: phosphopantetheine-binding protein [Chryseolinea]|jgi:acyl carrier protein|uniref:Acyl carrier protein n=1 Tax=Chryseolinea serpens TaxID=947013 RepID=A0A1M5TGR2_9BACT|nr:MULTISPECIES: phosphopantetheine-binding protein [Chryseolinea]SHH49942.1 acyl carrier protein [Chryseolinea serpens]